MLLGCVAGCGTEPVESDPDTSDVTTTTTDASTDDSSDVGGNTTDTSATGTEDNADTTTAGTNATTAPSGQGGNKVTATTAKKTNAPPPENYDITTAPLPSRQLKDKHLTYFYWAEMEKDPKSWHQLMKKQYGIVFDVKMANFGNYWSTLAMLIRSGESPDIVEVPNWDMYPRAINDDLLEPLDDILNLNDGLWNETRETMEKYKWKGKTYLTFLYSHMYSWFYYNEKMMKNYGIKKTPKELFLEDNWTLEECKKIADQFVNKSKGTFGLTIQCCNIMAITGVPLVEKDAAKNYKLNIKDPKIAQVMNWVHSMGVAGSNALVCADPIGDFCNGKCPMIITYDYLFVDERPQKIRDDINWVPMPKMNKDADYYLEMNEKANLGIVKGADNIEGAALALEFRRWLYLGRRQTTDFLKPIENAATKKYKLSMAADYDLLDADEVAWTEEILKKYEYKFADVSWRSWISTNGYEANFPGYYEAMREGKAWSALINEEYNRIDALLKSMFL